MTAGPFDGAQPFEGAQPCDDGEADRGFGNRLTRKEQLVEVGVFLLLIVPTMILSYFVTSQGTASFSLLATATIIRDLSLVALIVFFLWRNGESPERIGWTYRHEWTDIILGLVLFVPVFFLAVFLGNLLMHLGFSGPSPSAMQALEPHGGVQFALAIFLVIIVAISEEMIFRGYLIRRFASSTGSVAAAVIFATVIFAFGHGYEGSAGLITVGFIGLVYSLIYVWRGSLAAPVVMHFLQDFLAIVLVPYLAHR